MIITPGAGGIGSAAASQEAQTAEEKAHSKEVSQANQTAKDDLTKAWDKVLQTVGQNSAASKAPSDNSDNVWHGRFHS
jgi:hypothetical protein